jgi:hypothetical protein
MKKLLLCVSLVIWGVISCRTGPEPEVGTTRRALSAPLPPVSDYTAGTSLPSGGYTHLVVALCPDPDHLPFSAAFVDASSGAVVTLLSGRDPTLTSRFLSSAYTLGVPVTVYTAPVLLLSEQQPPPTGPTGEPLPINGVVVPPCTPNGDTSDPPPEGETGGEEAWWELFGNLSLQTAEALHQVSRAPPPPTSP